MAKQPKTNTQVGDYNYFRTSLNIGYDKDGKPIKRQFYGKNKSEAEAKKKEYEKLLQEGINPDLASQTLLKSIHDWFWTIEKNSGNKTSTFERYEIIYRKYIQDSSIGQMLVLTVNKIAIQNTIMSYLQAAVVFQW